MCGIVGKYYFDKRSFNSKDLSGMMLSIYHRGPDESGRFEDSRVALGFQRLSIIDTISGGQPLYNETKDIVALANGEVYNFRELRHLLELKNHRFRSNSDCEVIVHLSCANMGILRMIMLGNGPEFSFKRFSVRVFKTEIQSRT